MPEAARHARHARLDALTAVRGVAALMVVVYHARNSWHPVLASGERFTMAVATGWMWVHFFFILSGFVMMEAYGRDFAGAVRPRDYARFVVTRFGRIYPMHLAVLLFMAGAWRAGWMDVAESPGSFVASLALVQGFTYERLVWNQPAWSISTEWYTYLAFPFVVPLIARVRGRWSWLPWVTVAVVLVGSLVRQGDPDGESAAPIGRLVVCAIEFLLGCATHRLVRTGSWPRLRSRVAATSVCVAPMALLALPARFHGPALLLAVTPLFAVSIAVLATDRTLIDRLLATRALQFLGAISYSLYLVHEPLFALVRKAVETATGSRHALHDAPALPALATFPLFLALLVIVSWATWRWIEEPARHWFKRKARAFS